MLLLSASPLGKDYRALQPVRPGSWKATIIGGAGCDLKACDKMVRGGGKNEEKTEADARSMCVGSAEQVLLLIRLRMAASTLLTQEPLQLQSGPQQPGNPSRQSISSCSGSSCSQKWRHGPLLSAHGKVSSRLRRGQLGGGKQSKEEVHRPVEWESGWAWEWAPEDDGQVGGADSASMASNIRERSQTWDGREYGEVLELESGPGQSSCCKDAARPGCPRLLQFQTTSQ